MKKKAVALVLAGLLMVMDVVPIYASSIEATNINTTEETKEKAPIQEPLTDSIPEVDTVVTDSADGVSQLSEEQSDNGEIQELIPIIDEPVETSTTDSETQDVQLEEENVDSIPVIEPKEESINSDISTEVYSLGAKVASAAAITVDKSRSSSTVTVEQLNAGIQVSGTYDTPAYIEFTPTESGNYVLYTNESAYLAYGCIEEYNEAYNKYYYYGYSAGYENSEGDIGESYKGFRVVNTLEAGVTYRINTHSGSLDNLYTVYLEKVTDSTTDNKTVISATDDYSFAFNKAVGVSIESDNSKYCSFSIDNGSQYDVYINSTKIVKNSKGYYEAILNYGNNNLYIIADTSSNNQCVVSWLDNEITDIGEINGEKELTFNELKEKSQSEMFAFTVAEDGDYIFANQGYCNYDIYELNDNQYDRLYMNQNSCCETEYKKTYCVVNELSIGKKYICLVRNSEDNKNGIISSIRKINEYTYTDGMTVDFDYAAKVTYSIDEAGYYSIESSLEVDNFVYYITTENSSYSTYSNNWYRNISKEERFFNKGTVDIYLLEDCNNNHTTLNIKKGAEAVTLNTKNHVALSHTMYNKVYSYTPDESGYYAIHTENNYNECWIQVSGTTIDGDEENKYLQSLGMVSSNSIYDNNVLTMYNLVAGKTYYFAVLASGYNVDNCSADFDLYITKSSENELVWNADNTVASVNNNNENINVYKTANLKFTSKEKGFYRLDVNGPEESYIIDINGMSYHVYKGIGKVFYVNGENTEYDIKVIRETMSSVGDSVNVSVTNSGVVNNILLDANDEYADKTEIVDAEEEIWYKYAPEEDGLYVISAVNNEGEYNNCTYTDIYHETDSGMQWVNNTFYGDNFNVCNHDEGECDCYANRRIENTVVRLAKDENYYFKIRLSDDTETSEDIDVKFAKLPVVDITGTGKSEAKEYRLGVVYEYTTTEGGLYSVSCDVNKNYKLYTNNYSDYNSINAENIIAISNNTTKEVVLINNSGSTTFNAGMEIKNFDNETVSSVAGLNESIDVNIANEGDSYWVKFQPEVTGTYGIESWDNEYEAGSEDDSWTDVYDTYVSLYQKDANGMISYIDSNDDNGFSNNFRLETKLTAGNTYYYKIRMYSENETGTFKATLYKAVQDDLELGVSKDVEFNRTFSGQIDITGNSTCPVYKLSITNNGISPVEVRIGDSILNENYTIENERSIYIINDYYDRNENQNKVYKDIYIASTDFETKNLTIEVEPVTDEGQILEKNTTKNVTVNNIDELQIFSFTPAETGYYKFDFTNSENNDNIRKVVIYNTGSEGEVGPVSHSNNSTTNELEANVKYYIYVQSMIPEEYSITVSKVNKKIVFNYNRYLEFKNAGGKIYTVNEITDEIRDDCEDNLLEWWTLYNGNSVTYLVSDWSGLSDTEEYGYFEYADYEYVDEDTTYGNFLNQLRHWYWGYDSYTGERYVAKYFCDINGNIINNNAAMALKDECIFAMCGPENVKVRTVTISGANVVAVGSSINLTATISTGSTLKPEIEGVNWSSSNNGVATVDNNGKVTAMAPGTVIITAASKDGNAKATKKITVKSNIIYVSKVTISGTNSLDVGSNGKLQATLSTATGEEPTTKGVNWSSSDATVISIDNDGNISAKKPGNVTITATSKDGKASATCIVEAKEVFASKIKLSSSSLTMKKGTSYAGIEVTFNPSNTTNQNIKWTTSNRKVATVTSRGKIKAVGVGTAKITATTSNGRKATVKIKVTTAAVKVTKIKLSGDKTLKKGKKTKITATIAPVTATNKKVTWKSSNPKVATVTSSGVVKAKKPGKVTITATAKDGSRKKATIKITIKK